MHFYAWKQHKKLQAKAFSNFIFIIFENNFFIFKSTARRSAQFLWIFKPLFGNALKIEIPEPTTTEASK